MPSARRHRACESASSNSNSFSDVYRGTEIITDGPILVAKLQAGKLTDNEQISSMNNQTKTKLPNQQIASTLDAENDTDSESCSESDWDEDDEFDDDEEYYDSDDVVSTISNDDDMDL